MDSKRTSGPSSADAPGLSEPSGPASTSGPAGERPRVPAPLRPAATVMMVRDNPDASGPALEVLMVRRSLRADFVGGGYVFPGGGVDPADGGEEAEQRCAGRSDLEASALLGVPSGGLAYWVAALRECFEEAGLLLAYRAPGPGRPDRGAGQKGSPGPAGSSGGPGSKEILGPSHAARLSAAHRSSAGQHRSPAGKEASFLEMCREEDLLLAVDQVHYFAHWVAPEVVPRRYDTRFFVAPAPAGQTPMHDAGETIGAMWVNPHEALRLHREGQIEMLVPTVRNLQAIGRFSTSTELLHAAQAAAHRVPAILPRVMADGRGARIVLPGDPEWEQAGSPGTPLTATREEFDVMARNLALEANRQGLQATSGSLPGAPAASIMDMPQGERGERP